MRGEPFIGTCRQDRERVKGCPQAWSGVLWESYRHSRQKLSVLQGFTAMPAAWQDAV